MIVETRSDAVPQEKGHRGSQAIRRTRWRVVLTGWTSSSSPSHVAVSVRYAGYCVWSTTDEFASDLHTRKETREKAWQLDGWSETVSKVFITFLCCNALTKVVSDGRVFQADGFIHPHAVTVQPSKVIVFCLECVVPLDRSIFDPHGILGFETYEQPPMLMRMTWSASLAMCSAATNYTVIEV